MSAAHRAREHEEAKILLQDGEIHRASQYLESTLVKWGPHVSLLADLAQCFKASRDWESFLSAVRRFSLEFDRAQSKIEIHRRLELGLRLSDYLVDLGEVFEALKVLSLFREGLAEELKNLSRSDERFREVHSFHQRLMMKELLLRSSLFERQGVEELYQRVLLLGSDEYFAQQEEASTKELRELSLMQAELNIFGLSAGWQRYKKIHKKNKAQTPIVAVWRVMAEHALLMGVKAEVDAPVLESNQEYERIVLGLSQQEILPKIDLEEPLRRLSRFEEFKLSSLILKRWVGAPWIQTLKDRFFSLLENLTPDSKTLLRQWSLRTLSAKEIGVIEAHDSFYRLGPHLLESRATHKNLNRALNLFFNRRQLSHVEFLLGLGEELPAGSATTKIRNIIKKFNVETAELFGYREAFSLDRNFVYLEAPLRVRLFKEITPERI